MKVRVAEIKVLNDRVRAFTLCRADGGCLPAFTPGAHVAVDVVLNDGRTGRRRYSILSDPAQPASYEIAVLLQEDGHGGSRYMHTAVGVGQILEISEPVNHFPLETDNTHTILLAGGIGITPLLSMAHVLHARGASFELHYGARSPTDWIYRERILSLAGDQAFFYHDTGPEPVPLEVRRICSRPAPGTRIYACGPEGLHRSLRDLVTAGELRQEVLRYEGFGVEAAENAMGVLVTLAESGQTLQLEPGQTLLSALTRLGVPVAYDCMRGECGLCAVGYRDGVVDHRDHCLSDEDRKARLCLCVSRVKSDTIILGV